MSHILFYSFLHLYFLNIESQLPTLSLRPLIGLLRTGTTVRLHLGRCQHRRPRIVQCYFLEPNGRSLEEVHELVSNTVGARQYSQYSQRSGLDTIFHHHQQSDQGTRTLFASLATGHVTLSHRALSSHPLRQQYLGKTYKIFILDDALRDVQAARTVNLETSPDGAMVTEI